MMKSVFYCCTVLAVFGLCACTHQTPLPAKEPTSTVQYKALELSEQQKAVMAEEKERLAEEKKVSRQLKTHSLGIIGAVEPIYFLPMKGAFLARIDTGAQGSSVDVENLQEFEREGKKWVSFDLINQRTGEKHHYEKRFHKQVTIKRAEDSEERPVVLMTVKIGKEKLTVPFSLADRSKFEYQALVGRNILKGRAIVDVSVSKTLY